MDQRRFDEITDAVLNAISTERAVANIHTFFKNDHRFSYSEMIRTPDEIARQLGDMGLEPEVFELTCDGRTDYLDCIMPQVWDIDDARLELIAPAAEARVLGDYETCKLMVPNRCLETPEGGITGELMLESGLGHTGRSAEGKLVLSFEFPGKAKIRAMEEGALAMVSGFSESFGTIGDGVFWANGWSQSAGWYHSIDEPRLTTFMISYNEGKRLEALLKAGTRVVLKGHVKARMFDAALKAVSAVIPGRSDREMLILGHMYEPFPSDNADGNAAMLEIAYAVSSLIKAGTIPVPARSLRFLFSMEKYGAGHFFTDADRRKRVLAAMNSDSLSMSLEFGGPRLRKVLAPCAMPSIMDVVFEDAARRRCTYPWANGRGTYSDDTFMADPTIGVPTSWLNAPSGPKHHNTVITFETCDWDLYTAVMHTMAACALELICLDNDLAAARMPVYLDTLKTLARAEYDRLAARAANLPAARLAANYDFIARWNQARLASLKTFGVKQEQIDGASQKMAAWDGDIKQAALNGRGSSGRTRARAGWKGTETVIPHRLTMGIPFSLARIPFRERIKNPLESVTLNSDSDRLFPWMDGRRTLKECLELYEMDIAREIGADELKATLGYIDCLAKWGYLRLEVKTGV